jgi:hypothetical protein
VVYAKPPVGSPAHVLHYACLGVIGRPKAR